MRFPGRLNNIDHRDSHDFNDTHKNSSRNYAIGFFLSVFLTIIPFVLVIYDFFWNRYLTVLVILLFGATQIVVHLVYFLHMNPKSEGGWSMAAMLFTATIIVICFGGSVWVMYHLNTNMMPINVDVMHNMS